MKRVLGHGLKFVAVATLAFVLTPACANNDMSIFIRHVMLPPQSRTNGVCVYLGDPSLPALFSGIVDIRGRDTYEARLLVGNQLVGQSDPELLRAESNRARVNGAVVTVTKPNGGFIAEFSSPASGFIDPAGSTIPSFTPIGVNIIDLPTMRLIATLPSDRRLPTDLPFGESKLVLANIKVFGQTIGGVDLESGEFQFPIKVCNGCLVTFAKGDDPLAAGVDCTLALNDTDTSTLPCEVGQDESTPCQLCRGRLACQTF